MRAAASFLIWVEWDEPDDRVCREQEPTCRIGLAPACFAQRVSHLIEVPLDCQPTISHGAA
jgi:hypothetical protein